MDRPFRTLPMRTEPIDGESLDSWLERFAAAARYRTLTVAAEHSWSLSARCWQRRCRQPRSPLGGQGHRCGLREPGRRRRLEPNRGPRLVRPVLTRTTSMLYFRRAAYVCGGHELSDEKRRVLPVTRRIRFRRIRPRVSARLTVKGSDGVVRKQHHLWSSATSAERKRGLRVVCWLGEGVSLETSRWVPSSRLRSAE